MKAEGRIFIKWERQNEDGAFSPFSFLLSSLFPFVPTPLAG
jgi:hypothetical protein